MISKTKTNLTYQLIYQVLVLLLPLITAPYVSRILGSENIGLYSYSYSVVSYFVYFAMLGINNYGNKLIASVKNNKAQLNQEFSNLLFLHSISSLVVIFTYILYIKLTNDNRLYAGICIIYLLGALFDINWFFFGMEEFKITVKRNTIIKILTTILVFLFVREKNDLWKYILIMALGNVVSQSVVWIYIPKFTKIVKPKLDMLKQHITQLVIMFIPVIAVSLYKIMDKIMLKHMINAVAVGLYENSEKIINIPISILTAVGVVMLPRSSALLSENKEHAVLESIKTTTRYTLIISFALAFGLLSIGPEFAPVFFGNEFSYCGYLIQGLAITIPFMASANIIRTQYLIPKGYNRIYIISVIAGAIINIVFNIIFIPVFNSAGAVIGTIAAEVLVFFIQLFSVRRELHLGHVYLKTLPFLLLGILMCCIIRFAANCISNCNFLLFYEITFGILFYCISSCVLMYVQKDRLLLLLLQHIKELLKYN